MARYDTALNAQRIRKTAHHNTDVLDSHERLCSLWARVIHQAACNDRSSPRVKGQRQEGQLDGRGGVRLRLQRLVIESLCQMQVLQQQAYK